MKRFALSVPFAALLLFFGFGQIELVRAQTSSQTPVQDPQAISILQQSMKTMGGSAPSDSVATGVVQTVAGGETSQGTIKILTRGTTQTLIQMTMPDAARTTIYSNGQANDLLGATVEILPMELVVTSQAPEFPLPFIAALLADPDSSVQYVGFESVNGHSVNHIRVLDSFASQPALHTLSGFSQKDIWIDATSGLPQRISYVRKPAQGAVPGVAVDVYYPGYENHSGALYPSTIQKSMNGTPWATITIQSLSFNNGLSDSDFPVE